MQKVYIIYYYDDSKRGCDIALWAIGEVYGNKEMAEKARQKYVHELGYKETFIIEREVQ